MVAVGSGAGKTEREEHKNDRRDGRENDEGNEDPAHAGVFTHLLGTRARRHKRT
jgi:hypothetical protein